MAVAHVGCCTSLLYGKAGVSKNTANGRLALVEAQRVARFRPVPRVHNRDSGSPSKRSYAWEEADIIAGHSSRVPVHSVSPHAALTCATPAKWRARIEIMSNFETVLISAITSAGVALSIEWAAKPRLEARKERILEVAKAKRDIKQNLSIIVIIGSSLSGDFSSLVRQPPITF